MVSTYKKSTSLPLLASIDKELTRKAAYEVADTLFPKVWSSGHQFCRILLVFEELGFHCQISLGNAELNKLNGFLSVILFSKLMSNENVQERIIING